MSADYCTKCRIHTCQCERPRIDPWTNQRINVQSSLPPVPTPRP